MPEKFVTKRPHKKSRAGCQTCKTRKIKCDEARSSCGFCTSRGLSCDYTQVPRSQASSSPSDSAEGVVKSRGLLSPGADVSVESPSTVCELSSPVTMPILSTFTSNDLRLMHHWSTFTWKSIGIGSPIMDGVFEWALPNLAFNNEFLMNGLLGIASLHIQRSLPDPTEARKQTDIFRAKSFRTFRKAIINIDTKSERYPAVLMMAVMLVILCSQDYGEEGELIIVNWLVLFRGLSDLLTMGPDGIMTKTEVAPIFLRELSILQTPPAVPGKLIDMVALIDATDPDFEGLEFYCTAIDILGKLFASLQDDGLSGPLFVRIVSWPTHMHPVFVQYAKERRPRAMVILAYHLSFLKLMKGIWWIEGIAGRDLNLIAQMVGPEFLQYMEVPLQIRNISEPMDIMALLLQ